MSEEEETEWREYRLVVGGISEQAKQAIESVNGAVIPMAATNCVVYSVRLLYHPDDNEQGFIWFDDDGEKARRLYVCSADEHHDLYIYCDDGSIPCIQEHFKESDTAHLRLVTEAEWFAMPDN
jgi:hypothetical protein